MPYSSVQRHHHNLCLSCIILVEVLGHNASRSTHFMLRTNPENVTAILIACLDIPFPQLPKLTLVAIPSSTPPFWFRIFPTYVTNSVVRDPTLKAIITNLSRGTQSAAPRLYRLRGRILYRHYFHSAGSPWLLVVPEHLCHSILFLHWPPWGFEKFCDHDQLVLQKQRKCYLFLHIPQVQNMVANAEIAMQICNLQLFLLSLFL